MANVINFILLLIVGILAFIGAMTILFLILVINDRIEIETIDDDLINK